MTTQTQAARDKLVEDFKALATDAEELLRATASQTGERVDAARARVEERLRASRDKLAKLEQDVVEHTRATARATDQMVREHPWESVGIAAAVGFLLGMLTGRR